MRRQRLRRRTPYLVRARLRFPIVDLPVVSILGPSYSHGHVIDFYKKLRDEPTRLEGLGDGHQRKSYLHVQDCVTGILLAIDKQPPEERIAI